MSLNNKESIDQLLQGFNQSFRTQPINIYMNKEYLEQFNKDLGAEPTRDLKKYKGSNIVIWQHSCVSLGQVK